MSDRPTPIQPPLGQPKGDHLPPADTSTEGHSTRSPNERTEFLEDSPPVAH